MFDYFFFLAFKNIKLSPKTSFNTCIYHYNPRYDIYRYGSKDRKLHKKKYSRLIQDHHIIPKEVKDHQLIKAVNYDINSCNNLLIMPTKEGVRKFSFNENLQTHYKGHSKYNSFVKYHLDTIDKCHYLIDDKKYYFWLFYTYLKKCCPTIDSNIPWL